MGTRSCDILTLTKFEVFLARVKMTLYEDNTRAYIVLKLACIDRFLAQDLPPCKVHTVNEYLVKITVQD